MKNHDENKDLRLFSRIGKVDSITKTLKANKNQLIGIRMWGRIDYLTKYCGYVFIRDNSINANVANNDNNSSNYRDLKKARKEKQLTNKKK